MLTFLVGSKQAFEVSLADVAQTQLQGQTDVSLKFHVDDTTGANEKDSLMELSFHVPTSNTQFVGDEDHPSAQFEAEASVEGCLSLSEDLLATKYKDKLEASYQGAISDVFTGILLGLSGAKVTRVGSFCSCQGGSAVKSSLKAEDGLLYPLEEGFFFLPKPPTLILHDEVMVCGTYDYQALLSCDILSHCGEHCTPNELVQIEYVEFERHGAGGSSVSSHYFDLLVKLKNDQEHLFRNIQRSEYHRLFDFIT